MHLLYTDETNVDPAKSDFFAYAGVAIPGDVAGQLSRSVDAVRAANGYGADDILKFNTKERPSHVPPEATGKPKGSFWNKLPHTGLSCSARSFFTELRLVRRPLDSTK